jgi:hypothetical protein
MGQQVTGCSHRRQGPPAQMAHSDRRRFTPATGTRASRRAPMSSVTVSSLSTAGPAPARTADRLTQLRRGPAGRTLEPSDTPPGIWKGCVS